jgi:membrane protein YqaA with SNARE-associated domain
LRVVGDAIVALAGAARAHCRVLLWTLIGKAARYAAVAWIALHV